MDGQETNVHKQREKDPEDVSGTEIEGGREGARKGKRLEVLQLTRTNTYAACVLLPQPLFVTVVVEASPC